MSIKAYSSQAAAIKMLRKCGIPRSECGRFITPNASIGKKSYHVNIIAVKNYLKANGIKPPNAEKKPYISELIRKMIQDGLSNIEIQNKLEQEYNVGESKKYKITQLRSEFRRKALRNYLISHGIPRIPNVKGEKVKREYL